MWLLGKQRSTRGGMLALVLLGGTLSACTGGEVAPNPFGDEFGVPCLVDDDCGDDGLRCVSVDSNSGFVCTAGCGSDSDCPDGSQCVSTVLGSFCEPPPQISDPVNNNPDPVNNNPDPVNNDPDPVNNDPDPVNNDPDPVNNDPDPGGCTSNDDCTGGQVCDTNSGQCVDPTGCNDDSFEPNGELSSAAVVQAGNFPSLSLCEGDEDFFAFDASDSGSLTFEINYDQQISGLAMQLLDAQGEVLQSAVGLNGTITITRTIPRAGRFHARVYSPNPGAENTYDLTVGLMEGPTPDPDPDPNSQCADLYEPNNSPAQARSTIPTSLPDLGLCQDDPVDFFSIDLRAGQTIQTTAFSFDFSLTTVAGLEIRDTDGVTTLSSATFLFGFADTEFTVQSDGTYYVMVEQLLGDPFTYDLDISTDSPPSPPTCDSDPFEPNNTSADAVMLTNSLSGAISCPNDDDFFQIEVAEDDVALTITANFNASFGDVDLELLDSDGQTVLTSATSRGAGETLTWQALTAGSYFVRAFLGSGQNTSYQIRVAQGNEAGCNDRFEPNNTSDDATPVSEGVYDSLDLCDTDDEDDYFAVTVSAGATINARALFSDAIADIDMTLLDTNGISTLDSSGSATDNEEVSATVTTAGTYYIRVYHFSGDPNTYTLEVDVTDPGPDPDPSCNDAYEPNNISANASLISEGSYDNLTLCDTDDDDDFFAIFLEAGNTITVNTFFSHSISDLELRLLDTNGTSSLDASLSSSDNEEVSATVTSDGTYYIQAYTIGGAPNSYRMEVSVQDSDNPMPDQCNDRYESNNSYTAAATLTPGTYDMLNMCAITDEDDFYAVTLSAGDTITVSMLFSDSIADLDLDLLDTNGISTLDSSTSVTDNEEVSATVTSDGTYYIQASHYSGDPNSYTLEITVD